MSKLVKNKKAATPRRARPRAEVPGAQTRQRLLDCAESLFAARGFRDVSLREIIAAANVNIAAANYHFGAKEDLLEHVFARCATPYAEEWARQMHLAQSHSEAPDFLERLISALITPNFRASSGDSQSLHNFNRLRTQIFSEDRDFATRIMAKIFAPLVSEMIQAFARALPHLSAADRAWRIHIMLGSIVFTSMPGAQVHAIKDYSPSDGDEAIEYLVPLITALFRAPSIEEAEPATRVP